MKEKFILEISEKRIGKIPIEINRMAIGMCNEVYELKYRFRSYILRMNQEKEWIYGTHKFLPLFQQLQIKTPRIVAEDYTKTEFPFCYQILTKIEGKDLVLVFHELSPLELKGIAKEVSMIFDKFNSLSYEKHFGGLTGLQENNIESLLKIIEDKRKIIVERNKFSRVIDQEIFDIQNRLLKKYESYYLSVKPKLYYDDISSKNVMIHNGRFNGLVDLDFLMKGDYLQGVGGIIADWYGSESGEMYINEIFKQLRLNQFQQKIATVYAILHLILWTSEEGIKFNNNTVGEINWLNVQKKRRKIIDLYHSIK